MSSHVFTSHLESFWALYGVECCYTECLLRIAPLYRVVLGIAILLGLVHGDISVGMLVAEICLMQKWGFAKWMVLFTCDELHKIYMKLLQIIASRSKGEETTGLRSLLAIEFNKYSLLDSQSGMSMLLNQMLFKQKI